MQEANGDFLIYGGLMVDAANLPKLSSAVDAIRKKFGVPEDFHLKFNPGPEGFSHEQFIELKREVVAVAVEHDVKMFAYVILHDIATDAHTARRNGINTVCLYFNEIVGRLKDHGLVLIDRFNDDGNQIEAHLRTKFSTGVSMPDGTKRLGNIVGLHYSAIGQAHMPTIVDIVIGSFRFAVNVHTRNQDHLAKTASACCKMIEPLFLRDKAGAPIHELSFCFSPKKVNVPHFREKYQSLKDFLSANGIDTRQAINGS